MHKILLIILSVLKAETFLLSLILSFSNLKSLSFLSIFFYIFMGSFCYNLFMFFLGRMVSFNILERLLSTKINEKIEIFLDKKPIFFIVFYRFITGFKLFSAFLISDKVSFREFFIFNIVGDLLWSLFIIFTCKVFFYFNLFLSVKFTCLLFIGNLFLSFLILYAIFKSID